MGYIIIQIPQKHTIRQFEVTDETAAKLIAELEQPNIPTTTRSGNAELDTDESIIGIWADRFSTDEEAIEFARQLRRNAWGR